MSQRLFRKENVWTFNACGLAIAVTVVTVMVVRFYSQGAAAEELVRRQIREIGQATNITIDMNYNFHSEITDPAKIQAIADLFKNAKTQFDTEKSPPHFTLLGQTTYGSNVWLDFTIERPGNSERMRWYIDRIWTEAGPVIKLENFEPVPLVRLLRSWNYFREESPDSLKMNGWPWRTTS